MLEELLGLAADYMADVSPILVVWTWEFGANWLKSDEAELVLMFI